MSIDHPTPSAERQAHRARYEALRIEGQGATARALPPLTDRRHALPESAVLHRERLPGGWYWSMGTSSLLAAFGQFVGRLVQ
jgi:hypothetical protein